MRKEEKCSDVAVSVHKVTVRMTQNQRIGKLMSMKIAQQFVSGVNR